MIHTVPLATAAFLATLTLAGGQLTAQDILISEVRADSAERWVEVHNRSANTVNIGTWSLHYSTHTPGQAQSYWWPFPLGTTLGADQYLRVHWYQASPGGVGPGEFYTGTTSQSFLFGLGGEVLHSEAGALALIASQSNEQMNNASMVRDWVSWGDHGFLREYLAVQSGYWNDDRHCPAIPGGQSLARNTASIGTMTTRDLEWFIDPTPTPGSANMSGVSVTSYGQSCAVLGHHLLGIPQLRTTSLPLLGNAQFGYEVENTTGVFGECMLFAFSAAQAPSGLPSLLPPVPGAACRESIDTRIVLTTLVMSTRIMTTSVPMSLATIPPAMSGVELHAQAMVFDWLPNAWPPYQGLSNALRIVLGQ